MIINGENIYLFPLTKEDLLTWIENVDELETKWQLKIIDKNLAPFMQKIYKIKIENIEKDEKNYMYYTYFVIVLKSEKSVIGSIGFKGLPDDNNSCEIGYGINENYRNKGLMKESLKVFIKWAFDNFTIDYIRAETEKNNYPSQKVLKYLNAIITTDTQDMILWKIEKNNFII